MKKTNREQPTMAGVFTQLLSNEHPYFQSPPEAAASRGAQPFQLVRSMGETCPPECSVSCGSTTLGHTFCVCQDNEGNLC